jgi:hypothetical protein
MRDMPSFRLKNSRYLDFLISKLAYRRESIIIIASLQKLPHPPPLLYTIWLWRLRFSGQVHYKIRGKDVHMQSLAKAALIVRYAE